jgi:hypothetical protein
MNLKGVAYWTAQAWVEIEVSTPAGLWRKLLREKEKQIEVN